MNRRFLAVSVLLLGVCVVGASARQHQHGASSPARTAAVVPQKPAPAGALPPLPRVNYAPSAPMAVVQQVYEFAARHPEVLQYMPCYCGCERAGLGHRSNHECFVKSRAANGRITEWDEHGIGCAMCLQVGFRAMTLFNQNKSVAEIRTTIDKEIGSKYPSATPTPAPPKKRS